MKIPLEAQTVINIHSKVTGVGSRLRDKCLLKVALMCFKGFNTSTFSYFLQPTEKPNVKNNAFVVVRATDPVTDSSSLFACHWLLIKKCWRLQIYLPKLELLIVHIITNSESTVRLSFWFFKPPWTEQVNRVSDETLSHLNLHPWKSSIWRFQRMWEDLLWTVRNAKALDSHFYLQPADKHSSEGLFTSLSTQRCSPVASIVTVKKFWGTNYLVWCKRAQWRYEITLAQLNGGGI